MDKYFLLLLLIGILIALFMYQDKIFPNNISFRPRYKTVKKPINNKHKKANKISKEKKHNKSKTKNKPNTKSKSKTKSKTKKIESNSEIDSEIDSDINNTNMSNGSDLSDMNSLSIPDDNLSMSEFSVGSLSLGRRSFGTFNSDEFGSNISKLSVQDNSFSD